MRAGAENWRVKCGRGIRAAEKGLERAFFFCLDCLRCCSHKN
jgi:hypothetical protein